MKCLYYLSPNLASTENIAEDLQRSGVRNWFMHILCKDEAGLKRKQLHSSNYLETLDVMRDGLCGAGAGLLGGLALAGLTALFQPFGSSLPVIAYLAIIFLVTCFGAWVGGLVGVCSENKKLRRFHDEIEAGKYLFLIYASRHQEDKVQDMMRRLHPEARLVGYDSYFYNPFSEPTLLQASS